MTDTKIKVEVEFHSFELAPDTPVDFEGNEVDFLAHHKGMAPEQVEAMLAHQLLHFAKSRGVQHAMKERLLSAYFEQGRHVGRIEELADLATDVGLDRDEVVAVLEDGTHAADVEADIDQARAYGISGVPFFVLDGKYGVSGAQDPSAFVEVLTQLAGDAGTPTPSGSTAGH